MCVCVCVWVGSMSVHWCMQSRINNCCNPVRLVRMIHCLWMIQGASKSTTPVPQIQRFDSLKAGKRIPTWPLVMSLTAFASIICLPMTQYYSNLKLAPHQWFFFLLNWALCAHQLSGSSFYMFCQRFRCPGAAIWLFAEMSIKSTLGVLLNWFHLLGTLHRVLPVICSYPPPLPPQLCLPPSTAKISPPAPMEPRM